MRLMPAMPFSIALLVGVIVGYYLPLQSNIWLLIPKIVVLMSAIAALLNSKCRPWVLKIAFLFLGILLMTSQRQKDDVTLPNDKVSLNIISVESFSESEKLYTSDFVILNGEMKGRKVRCYMRKDSNFKPNLGATYNVVGKLQPFLDFGDDSNFSFKRWADSHSLSAQMFLYGNKISRTENAIQELTFFQRVSLKSKLIRERLLEMLKENGITDGNHAVMAAMAFGDKSALSKETRDVYAKTGVAHLLALSGMHLGVLFMLLTMVFGRLRSRVLSSIIVVTSVWIYVVFVGMPASVVRAATMLTIYTVVTLDGRNKMSINALFVTFTVMVVCNPMIIWDAGFQLSFLSMLSIFLYFTPIYNMVSVKILFKHPVFRYIWTTVSLSLAAQIGTSPLTMYYFGRFTTLFLITNIVAIPLVTILLYSVFLVLIFWMVPFIKMALLLSIQMFSSLLSWILDFFASWQWVSIENISINWIQLMLIYIMLAVFTYMAKRVIIR